MFRRVTYKEAPFWVLVFSSEAFAKAFRSLVWHWAVPMHLFEVLLQLRAGPKLGCSSWLQHPPPPGALLALEGSPFFLQGPAKKFSAFTATIFEGKKVFRSGQKWRF